MTTHVTASGFDAHGVRLISPADVEFDALVHALAAPGWAQTILEAAPSVVIVANQTARRIVALSTRFSVDNDGYPSTNSVFFVAPDAIALADVNYGRSSAKAILPDEHRMIGFNFAVPDRTYYEKFTQDESDFYDPQVRSWIRSTASDLASAHRVHVTFDAVVFDDGTLLGDNTGPLAAHFDALVQTKQSAYRSVLDSLDADQHAVDVVNRFCEPAAPGPPDEMTTAWFAANEARNTVATLLQNYGADALPSVLRRASLPQPFIIRRRIASE